MHDIICPHCGETFIASDVSFDLSQYVLPLLYSNPKDSDDVRSVGFQYYTDEDTICKHTVPGNKVPLICDTAGGPDLADDWFPFVITKKMLLDHIAESISLDIPLEDMLREIRDVANTRGASYTVRHVEAIQAIYRRFFSVSRGEYSAFDIDDANVRVVIKILLHLLEDQQQSVNVKVRLYCSKLNTQKPDYRVPDVLFVLKNGIIQERHYKCCRYCGTTFPTEYGYYKMMPVVLLGSHYAGKTSYLLSLLYTAKELPPFSHDGIGNKSINVATLNEDNDLIAFSKNIERFKRGEDPDKTDFTNVPILNLLVNNIIYTFIDWPGEKFIDGDVRRNDDFVYQTRRVIRKARHFYCFLEPSQIDLNRNESEERVRFSANELMASFDWHMRFPGLNKLRSITFVVNKIDLFNGDERNEPNPNAQGILNLAQSKTETSVFSEGRWNQEEFTVVDRTTREFLQIQNPNLLAALSNMPYFAKVPQAYIPVAPYGDKNRETSSMVIHRTRLAGVPLLRIMELDKKLLKRS